MNLAMNAYFPTKKVLRWTAPSILDMRPPHFEGKRPLNTPSEFIL